MTSHLLILGGGSTALPALRWAREAGLSTVLVDPEPRVRGRALAQSFHNIPLEDSDAHGALARRLAQDGLAGILATGAGGRALLAHIAPSVPGLLPTRSALEQLNGDCGRAALEGRGFPVAKESWAAPRELDLFAFFRDGAFVAGGSATRESLPSGDVQSLQPSGLDAEREREAFILFERAARDLGLALGPLQATLVEDEQGLAFRALHAGFEDMLGATWIARRAYGKSPLQAWFAHLAGVGGPFDELPRQAEQSAGWLALMPSRTGLFAGVDGLSRARAVPGRIELAIDEPGRELAAPELEQRALGHLWAEAHDSRELRERLTAARSALEVRIACRQQVA